MKEKVDGHRKQQEKGGFLIIATPEDNGDLDGAVYYRRFGRCIWSSDESEFEPEPKPPKPIHGGWDYTALSRPRKYNRFTVQAMSSEAIEREWHNIWDFYEPQR